MILGAGLGTRLQPLTDLRPKPALPVRGIPVIGYALGLLAHHGVREVAINLHHLPDAVEAAAREHCPPEVELHFAREPELLGTGGGIRNLAAFLAGSESCLVLAGDMILDADLGELARIHHSRGDAVTFLLRDDPRGATFGSIGIDGEGRVRRIASRFELQGEKRAGIYVHATVISAAALRSLPARRAFGHLDDWIMPLLADGADDIRGHVLAAEDCLWEPVGTPEEYLAANLEPAPVSFFDLEAQARRSGTRIQGDVVLGAGARLGPDVALSRAVVWDGESVPAGFAGSDGVFAGGRFHSCRAVDGRDRHA